MWLGFLSRLWWRDCKLFGGEFRVASGGENVNYLAKVANGYHLEVIYVCVCPGGNITHQREIKERMEKKSLPTQTL